MSKKSWWYFGSFLVFLGLAAASWLYRYDIHDWIVLRDYNPPAEIEALSSSSGMDSYGQRLFYVHKPQLLDNEEFNQNCNNFGEKTIVLGCYTGEGIYIFDVQKTELEGVEEVTAAHEMLHAAYVRLSSSERSEVDSMVQEMYSNLSDARITELVKSYEAQDPRVVPNELHSILATEVENLSPELEEYYDQYFSDRQKVVSLAKEYEQVFSDAQNEAERLSANLSLRRVEINSNEEALDRLDNQISAGRAELDSLEAANNWSAFNSKVPGYNRLVNEFNSLVGENKTLIAEYNIIVQEYNEVALYQQELVQSIDSNYNPKDN